MLSTNYGRYIVSHDMAIDFYKLRRSLNIGTDKDIPKAQRRGAIVVLGMVAVAKPKVVTERIDTLLHVGLGPLGKVGGFHADTFRTLTW
jgi:hypothetical protein